MRRKDRSGPGMATSVVERVSGTGWSDKARHTAGEMIKSKTSRQRERLMAKRPFPWAWQRASQEAGAQEILSFIGNLRVRHFAHGYAEFEKPKFDHE